MNASTTVNADICLETLRDTDRDRYLACLLSPEEKRADLAALYAFNAEIARVRDVAREPLPGEVRLQWWRDLLEGSATGDSTASPIASALLSTVERHRLPRKPLLDMLDARIFDLYDDAMEDRAALEGYAGETVSALIQLASLVLSPQNAARGADAAGHAGVAQAIAGLIMLLPLHRARGQVYVPLDILRAVGIDRDGFLEANDSKRVAAAIEIFASLGLEHLAKARASGIDPAVISAFLPVAIAEPVLRSALRHGAETADTPFQAAQWRRQWWMAKALLLKRI